jgi:hypothetical protein
VLETQMVQAASNSPSGNGIARASACTQSACDILPGPLLRYPAPCSRRPHPAMSLRRSRSRACAPRSDGCFPQTPLRAPGCGGLGPPSGRSARSAPVGRRRQRRRTAAVRDPIRSPGAGLWLQHVARVAPASA